VESLGGRGPEQGSQPRLIRNRTDARGKADGSARLHDDKATSACGASQQRGEALQLGSLASTSQPRAPSQRIERAAPVRGAAQSAARGKPRERIQRRRRGPRGRSRADPHWSKRRGARPGASSTAKEILARKWPARLTLSPDSSTRTTSTVTARRRPVRTGRPRGGTNRVPPARQAGRGCHIRRPEPSKGARPLDSDAVLQIRAWLREAGFRETTLRNLVGTGSNVVWSMVVGIK
jgi:hypothetical protein